MRILHYGLSAHLGGIETYLYKLYKNIDREEYQFDFLVVGDEEPCFYNEFSEMGSNFYFATPASKNPFKNKKEIFNHIKSQNFDVIHCHLNSLSNIEIVKAGIKHRIPTIVHSRNAGLGLKTIYKYLHSINRFLLPKNSLELLAVSDLAGEWMFGKTKEFTVINNGIDVNQYQFDLLQRQEVRRELGLDDQYTIVNVGALREQKNHFFLLDVFKEVLREHENATLLLVGEGKLREKIQRKILELNLEDNVFLLGNRPDVNKILSASDFFLFPSLFEGFPNAVLEAQTAGLPCLISDTITKEVCVSSDCEYLSIKKTPKEWALKILDQIKLTKKLELGDYNKNRVEKSKKVKERKLDVESEIIKIQNIYRSLSGGV